VDPSVEGQWEADPWAEVDLSAVDLWVGDPSAEDRWEADWSAGHWSVVDWWAVES
jgi:hypothetical protein